MRRSTLFLLSILAATLLFSWFVSSYEKVTRTEFTGFSGEARINKFLAAELLLRDVDIDAESVASLKPSSWMPENTDTVVTQLSSNIALGADREQLMLWVDYGGHLILFPPQQPSEFTDELAQQFGFRFVAVEVDYDNLEEERSGDEEDTDDYSYFIDLDYTLYRIEATDPDPVFAFLSDDKGSVALRRSWGDGFVTVLADSSFFTNYSLNNLDHARLMLDVVAGYLDPGKVWLVFDASFPPLWRRIWMAAPYFVIGFFVLLFAALWSRMPSFGPTILPEPPVRRSILEHVRAAGHFAWRNDGSYELSRSAATALIHDAESRHPGISQLAADKQARRLSQITGLDAQDILDALTDRGNPRHREFIQHMQSIMKIRNEL